MRYALIGCGRISPNHIAAAKNNGLEIVALCDLAIENIKSLKRKFLLDSTVKEYLDYKEMLNNEQIDLIAIATESGKHADIALDCLDYNCNVIIEKPIALSLEEANSIIKKAEETNLKVCTCHQNRFNKSIQKIRSAIEEKRFGRLLYATAHIRWNRNEYYYKQAPWRGTWDMDGGALMNQCIHNIDLLRWMMGDDVEEVIGLTDNLNHPYIQAEDMGIALIRFKNGGYGVVEGTTNIYPENLEETLYIFGEKGTVKAGGQSVNCLEEWQFADKADNREEVIRTFTEIPPNIYGFGHSPLYSDVVEAVEQNRKPYVDAEAGKKALELVLAIYKSSFEHTHVQLPLSECSTMNYKDCSFKYNMEEI